MTKPGVYRHYKGPLYTVLMTAQDSTNGRGESPVVVYVSHSTGNVCVRAEAEFNELMGEPFSVRYPRFTFIGTEVKPFVAPEEP